jgi:hypothetical protein
VLRIPVRMDLHDFWENGWGSGSASASKKNLDKGGYRSPPRRKSQDLHLNMYGTATSGRVVGRYLGNEWKHGLDGMAVVDWHVVVQRLRRKPKSTVSRLSSRFGQRICCWIAGSGFALNSKFRSFKGPIWSHGGPLTLKVVANSHHFDEEQEPDPDPDLVKSWIRIRIKNLKGRGIRNPGIMQLKFIFGKLKGTCFHRGFLV